MGFSEAMFKLFVNISSLVDPSSPCQLLFFSHVIARMNLSSSFCRHRLVEHSRRSHSSAGGNLRSDSTQRKLMRHEISLRHPLFASKVIPSVNMMKILRQTFYQRAIKIVESENYVFCSNVSLTHSTFK